MTIHIMKNARDIVGPIYSTVYDTWCGFTENPAKEIISSTYEIDRGTLKQMCLCCIRQYGRYILSNSYK
jgi:hypothetical protein